MDYVEIYIAREIVFVCETVIIHNTAIVTGTSIISTNQTLWNIIRAAFGVIRKQRYQKKNKNDSNGHKQS